MTSGLARLARFMRRIKPLSSSVVTRMAIPALDRDRRSSQRCLPGRPTAVYVSYRPTMIIAARLAPLPMMKAGVVTVVTPNRKPELTLLSYVTVTAAAGMKVAVTDFAALVFTVQAAPETASHPLHPAKTDVVAGVAVKVTTVPLSYWAEQAEPQLIPPGAEVTVPLPAQSFATVSVNRRTKLAVTRFAAIMFTVQNRSLLESHPVQPVKRDEFDDAVRVTDVP